MNWATSHQETRGPLREVVQNGRLLKEEGWGGGAIGKRKEIIIFRPGHVFGDSKWQGFYFVNCIFFGCVWGWGKGPHGRLPYWRLTRKFQMGWLTLHFRWRSKLQLSEILSLGLIWDLAQWHHFGPKVLSLTKGVL